MSTTGPGQELFTEIMILKILTNCNYILHCGSVEAGKHHCSLFRLMCIQITTNSCFLIAKVITSQQDSTGTTGEGAAHHQLGTTPFTGPNLKIIPKLQGKTRSLQRIKRRYVKTTLTLGRGKNALRKRDPWKASFNVFALKIKAGHSRSAGC